MDVKSRQGRSSQATASSSPLERRSGPPRSPRGAAPSYRGSEPLRSHELSVLTNVDERAFVPPSSRSPPPARPPKVLTSSAELRTSDTGSLIRSNWFPKAEKTSRVASVSMATNLTRSSGMEELFPNQLPPSGVPEILVVLREQMHFLLNSQEPVYSQGNGESVIVRIRDSGKQWQNVVFSLTVDECLEVLCHFLRELSRPLLTMELCKWFMEAEAISDEEFQFYLFHSLVDCLPVVNRSMLQYVLESVPLYNSPLFPRALILGPALLGLPQNLPGGKAFLASMRSPHAIDTVFLNKGRDRRNNSNADKAADLTTRAIIACCTPNAVLYLLCDPYYSSLVEGNFADLLLQMHEYIWPSPTEMLDAFIPFFQKMLIPQGWAIDARRRLLSFLKNLLPLLDADIFSQDNWRSKWSSVSALLMDDLNFIQDADFPSSIPEDIHTISTFVPRPVKYVNINTLYTSTSGMGPLLQMSPENVAKALRRFFLQPFTALSWKHIIKQRWMEASQSPPFADLVSSFNGLQSWAVSWILEAEEAKDRANHLVFIIKCAHHCVKLNNFHAALALFFGTSDPAISRLTKTWAKVGSKPQGYFNDLSSLADPKSNHASYTAALKNASSSPPVIPYMALVSKYLFSMEEANPDYIEGMLNFMKFRMIYSFVTPIFQLQRNAGPIVDATVSFQDANLLSFFSTVCYKKAYDSKALYERSLQLEPRAE